MNKSLFNQEYVDNLLQRLDQLESTTRPQWGRMNASQMLVHCQQGLNTALGKLKTKKTIIAIFFGKWAKNWLIKKQGIRPFKKNLMTAKEFVANSTYQFDAERERFKNLIQEFQQKHTDAFASLPHPFFGMMTPEEWDKLQVKHIEHHFIQFGI